MKRDVMSVRPWLPQTEMLGVIVAYAGLVAEHRRRQRCRVLLVEGTSVRKRHRYVTVLANGDTGEVLAMAPHRDTQALSGFLAAQGHKWRKGVKVAVSEGSKAYKAAIEMRLGHARHVLDRFADIYRTGDIPEFSDTLGPVILAPLNQVSLGQRAQSDFAHSPRPSARARRSSTTSDVNGRPSPDSSPSAIHRRKRRAASSC